MNVVKLVFMSTVTAVVAQIIILIVSFRRFSKNKRYYLNKFEIIALIVFLVLPPVVYSIFSLSTNTTSTNPIGLWVKIIASSIAVPWGLALPVPLISIVSLLMHHSAGKKHQDCGTGDGSLSQDEKPN